MPQNPRVALDVETSRIYGRRILSGITQYVRSHRPWSIYLEQQELGRTPADLFKRWRGDGIITRQTNPQFARSLRRRRERGVEITRDVVGALRSTGWTIGSIERFVADEPDGRTTQWVDVVAFDLDGERAGSPEG